MLIFVCYALFLSIPKLLLSLLQLGFLKKESAKEPYILEKAKFIQAAHYASLRERLSIISTLLDLVLVGFWLLFGFSALERTLDFAPLMESVVFVLCFLVVQFVVQLPLEAYQTLVLDKAFGFAKGGVKLFVVDTLKSFVLLLVVGGILIFVLSWIILNVQNWELYAFILGAVLIVSLNVLYPTIIAPLFNKFSPLEDAELKQRINALLMRVGFKSEGVFVMDASKRDGRLNAYFAGLGRAKRVILFDTLLDKISHESLLAVLGHELGHFKHYDIYKMMALILGFFAALVFFVANMPEMLFASANLEMSPQASIIFLLIISAPFGFYFMLVVNFLSCKNEFNADKFGASLTTKEALANALLVLVKENNSFPLAHPLYMCFYYSHPPLMARLIALDCGYLGKNATQGF
ncbi:M48 family metallopeptidase [Helicobacter turcicus]|uniref:M48 family metallopeptidase n=1 Tax=Helicobacter turcicus TaxID=2867412 RepID=A0ABS7JNE2_9HELI|nr:M48 family metallopeptidase [Helicobacter turcicus]MBX7490918.1 M48 family metallopeptidase [Helicobacter turcicus]MBX7545772.1 M48 family metallopeptidase [Helicobacter turcicus]